MPRRPPGRFDQVGRLLIQWDKGEGTVAFDDFRLVRGTRGERSCLPTVDERLTLAFPGGKGHRFVSDNFIVLTDVPGINAASVKPLLKRLESGLTLLHERYRVPRRMLGRAPLCIFARKEDYVAFFARLGKHFGVGLAPPSADGYSALGYGASTWDPKQGLDRPVFVHEAMHAALEQLLHLASDGNWIQEGLANAVQARLHLESTKADRSDLFARRARGESVFQPLGVLLAMRRPGTQRYLQLATFLEFLADKYAAQLPTFWNKVTTSWKLPHDSGRLALEAALDQPIETIGTAWITWGRTYYR